jgi:hypothetical protein
MVVMSASVSPQDRLYEQACDQAIAMCDGNLRSEYLELELQELRAAIACGCMPNKSSDEAHSSAA